MQNPEPLVLRAAAGECIRVHLTNILPDPMPDDPALSDSKTWSYNGMPPITKAFNFNQLRSSSYVGLHAGLIASNTATRDGANVGLNKTSLAHPSDATTTDYFWYAGDFTLKPKPLSNGKMGFEPADKPIEFGVVPLRDMGDVIKHPSHGAIGALVIEPKDSHWVTDFERNCGSKASEAPTDNCSNASATVYYGEDHKRAFRDFVLIYQDDVSLRQTYPHNEDDWAQPQTSVALPNLRNADDAEDTGQKAFNYRTEPLWARLRALPAADPETMAGYDFTNAFSSIACQGTCKPDVGKGVFCDPETPIFEAPAGMEVRLRVVHPGGHPRNHGFALFGHDWIMKPWVCGTESTVMGWNENSQNRYGSAYGVGPMRHVNILTTAGGEFHIPGDYMYRTQEGFMFAGGLWGIFRVTPSNEDYGGAPQIYCDH